MLEAERNNPFDVLICYRLDRISRNITDFSALINELTKYHTDFISIKEQFDTRTPMGRAMMYIASVFAQLEREVIAERIRDNMLELAKTGRWLGGQTPTGFKSERYEIVNVYEQNSDDTVEIKNKKACKLIIDDSEKKIIETIFNKYLELKSLTKLETYLIQNNIVSRTGVYFTTNRLRDILINPVYATYDQDVKEYFEQKGITIYAEGERAECNGKYGLISYNKLDNEQNKRKIYDWIIAVGCHSGYIKGIDWIKVQELIEKNADKRYRANSPNGALLSGIIRCKECGSFMRPKSTGNRNTSIGKKRYYYTCELKERSQGTKCNGKNIIGLDLDMVVLNKIKTIFAPNSKVYEELNKMSLSSNTKYDNEEEIQLLNKNYSKNENDIKSLIEKLKYIDIDVVSFINNELIRLKKENQNIQEKIKELQNQNNKQIQKQTKESHGAALVLNIINNYFDTFETLDLKLKRDILKILIKDIRGNGDNIEINILNTNLEENTKRLFFDRIAENNFKNFSRVAIRTGEQLQP